MLNLLPNQMNKLFVCFTKTSSFKYFYRHASSLFRISDIKNNKIFLNDKYGSFRYESLISMSYNLRDQIKQEVNFQPGDRVSIMCANNYTFLVSMLGVWLAGGVPVPLSPNFTTNYLAHFFSNSNTKLVIRSYDHLDYVNSNKSKSRTIHLVDRLSIPLLKLNESDFFVRNPSASIGTTDRSFENLIDSIQFNRHNNREALIIYTSGSSGPAKGVQLTFSSFLSYMQTMLDCWKLEPSDCLLHVMPLNHVHGLIYGLLLPFFVGAQVEMIPKFEAKSVWNKLVDQSNNVNIFTAVPNIYAKLIDFYKNDTNFKIAYRKDKLNSVLRSKIRIMASGSAPLNSKLFNNWFNLTGFRLVERYGLTEAGVCLSNSCDETLRKRIAGHVGRPFGELKVRIAELNDQHMSTGRVLIESDSEKDVLLVDNLKTKSISGELQIKGPMVFKGYQNAPEETKDAFTSDGWLKTGDIAEFLIELGVYKIIGRLSVDLIKVSGYKISALDIERELLLHPYIEDVAVMSLKDECKNEKIIALIVLKSDFKDLFDLNEFYRWCKLRLPSYSVPSKIEIVLKLHKNQMGKVNKKELIKIYY